MGEKFTKAIQARLRGRVDGLEDLLVASDPPLDGLVDKSALRPMFVALADQCIADEDGVLAMISPTIALTSNSGTHERRVLADRFAIDTLLTCHQPGNINLSQNTNINESIIILRRCHGNRPPTRVISLDRFPNDDTEVAELFEAIGQRGVGTLADGWGEVSEWPAERIQQGDWTAPIWRSPELAVAAARFAEDLALKPMGELELSCHQTQRELTGKYRETTADEHGSFPTIKGKGADGQQRIEASPNAHFAFTKVGQPPVLDKAGHLLVTQGQDTSTARLTAVASSRKRVGYSWMPITGISYRQAKAAAVFLNSTPGRLLLMRTPGRKLSFPDYAPAVFGSLPIPNLSDPHICSTLVDCWAATRRMTVPQFRDGECEVRELWDAAVCTALGWDEAEISALRRLLHAEPHVRGLAYGQFSE